MEEGLNLWRCVLSIAHWYLQACVHSMFVIDSVLPPFLSPGSTLEFPEYLSESLEVLYLNDNQLDAIPRSVCLLKGLTELYLGK